MVSMHNLLSELYTKNSEFGYNQLITNGNIPDHILMIDNVSIKKVSPQMRSFYEFALEWREAIFGLDVVNPNNLEFLYKDNNIKENIILVSENYKPIPPSNPSDWHRTALLAVEDGGVGTGVCFYWWLSEEHIEPCVIFISGGTINIFYDMNEFVGHLVKGYFPEKGEEVYKKLEEERGTLSD